MEEQSENLAYALTGYGSDWHFDILEMLLAQATVRLQKGIAYREEQKQNPDAVIEKRLRRGMAPSASFEDSIKNALVINKFMDDQARIVDESLEKELEAVNKLRALFTGKLYDEVAQLLRRGAAYLRSDPVWQDISAEWQKAHERDLADLYELLAKRFEAEATRFSNPQDEQ